MKRFTSLFIAIVMVLSVLGSVDAVYAQEPPVWTAGENVKVTVDEGVLTVSGNGDMQNYSKSNLPGWNRNNGEIVKIVVEKGVTSIGDFAFSSMMSVTEAVISDTVTYIGERAFSGCYLLSKIDIPASVDTIGSCAFSTSLSGMTKLSEIAVDANNKSFVAENGILYNKVKTVIYKIVPKTDIEILDVAPTVASIKNEAALTCTAIKEVNLPDSVNLVGAKAFAECKNLAKVVVNNRDCDLELGAIPNNSGLKLYGYADSNIALYAKNNGYGNIEFVSFECVNHKWDNGVVTKAATCTATGVKTYTCTVCGDTYKEPLELAEHTPIYKGYQEPTCTASGHTNLTVCSVCGEILNESEEIAPLGHSYTRTTVSPTCSQEGYDLYTCERCGISYKDNIIAPTGVHNIVIDKAIAPTCIKDGLTEGSHCSTCGLVIDKQEIINKTGHKYDNGVVVVAPTCTKTGIKLYNCKACNNTLTVVIDKNSHTYKNYVTKATMSANGSIVNKCSVCGAKKSTTTIYKVSSVALSTYSCYYTGTTRTPSVTVKDSKGKTLKNGTDYTVTYPSGRINVGRYAVKITLKGNYSGSKTLYYNIMPKGISKITKVTAKSKGFTVSWSTQKTQTTGYQIQYSTSSKFTNAKTITMPKNTYYAKSISGLTGNKKYYVRIRTYKVTKFGGKNYNIYSPWCASKSVTTKR